jgi:hypothetical protein
MTATLLSGYGNLAAARGQAVSSFILAMLQSRNDCIGESSTMKSTTLRLVVAALLLAGAQVHAQSMQKGAGGSEVQGSAGPSGAQNSNGLQQCEKPMGAIAVVEPQDEVLQSLARFNLQSPSGLIRLMVQQSNCFIVVERGVAMKNMQQERALADAGELRKGSNIGAGQMVGADFVLTPSIVFSEGNAGGIGGAVAGLFKDKSPALGALAGGLKFKEAQTSMLVTDSRSSVQVAAAEGSARKADLRLGAFLAAASPGFAGAGAISGYQNTNEGKVIAASFTDNYNNIVAAVRNNPSLQRDVGTLADEAGKQAKAGAVFNEGDTLVPKIATKLYGSPAETGKVVGPLSKGDEMIFTGEEKNGFLKVETGNGAGWVKKILVTR